MLPRAPMKQRMLIAMSIVFGSAVEVAGLARGAVSVPGPELGKVC